MNIENNLFYYATKELSQDAFICWLCSHALEGVENSDLALKECAEQLLRGFISAGENDMVSLKRIQKQVGNIDVLLTVDCKDQTYKIIIEDKVHASEHDDQLNRYMKQVSDSHESDVVKGVYFKTGFQDNYKEAKKADYLVFDRRMMLDLFNQYIDKTESDIFKDYYHYWNDFENATQKFISEPVSTWDWRSINGFFEKTKDEIEEKCWAGYNYVPNRSGGFWGLWYGVDECEIVKGDLKVSLYLQLEIAWNYERQPSGYDYQIVMKMENKSEQDVGEAFRDLRNRIIDVETKNGFERPRRLGSGVHVTVGVKTLSENTYSGLNKAIFDSIENYKNVLSCINS